MKFGGHDKHDTYSMKRKVFGSKGVLWTDKKSVNGGKGGWYSMEGTYGQEDLDGPQT